MIQCSTSTPVLVPRYHSCSRTPRAADRLAESGPGYTLGYPHQVYTLDYGTRTRYCTAARAPLQPLLLGGLLLIALGRHRVAALYSCWGEYYALLAWLRSTEAWDAC